MDNKEIRRKILEYIYQKNEEKPRYMAGREELKEYLSIEDAKLDNNVIYLEEKGYLKLLKAMGSLFCNAQITSYGIDLVESPEEFNTEFPIHVTQNIIQGSTGVIIGDNNKQSISISDSFKSVYEDIERKNPENKNQIVSEVKKIEEELEKETPDKSIITKSLDFLRGNAAWIIPTLTEIIKVSFGL